MMGKKWRDLRKEKEISKREAKAEAGIIPPKKFRGKMKRGRK